MNTCERFECNTTAGCAHRGPLGQYCWFPTPGPTPGEIEELRTALKDWQDSSEAYRHDAERLTAALAAKDAEIEAALRSMGIQAERIRDQDAEIERLREALKSNGQAL